MVKIFISIVNCRGSCDSELGSVNMGPGDKFCLQWNDFERNISEAFKELRDEKDFFDVTIACEEEEIQAHKLILAACSPFFR